MANKLPYLVISDMSMVESTIKRSRFIAVAFPVSNLEQIKDALGSLKKSNKSAKHIAYAYLLGENYEIARNNDDGEPAGSAGASIYRAIKEKRITNVLVAVVRYFGGIELGKSRLTRTYYSAALEALNSAKKHKMVYCGIFEMRCTLRDFGSLRKGLTEKGFPIIESNMEESMPMIKCAIPADTAERVIEEIRTKLNDSAQMIKVSSAYYRFSLGDR